MAPVDIGPNVFVGMSVKVLKGVTIGADSVIGAGSVVATSIPSGVIAAGKGTKYLPAYHASTPKTVWGHYGFSDEMVARGIRWAVDHGARIINMSLGGEETSPVQDDAIRYAYDRNVLVVAAAGNTPDGKPHFPAAYDKVLSVGATGRSETVTGFSSFGPYVDVSAPGVGILSTSWSDGSLTYEYGNGTSFSCPQVAGAAALVWSVNPSLTADDVRFTRADGSVGWGLWQHSLVHDAAYFRAVKRAPLHGGLLDPLRSHYFPS